MSEEKKATSDQVFSLAARFATKVNSLGPLEERVKRAIGDGEDLLWKVVTDTLSPPPQIVVPTSRPHIQILRETPKPCAQRTDDEQVAGMETMYKQLGWSFTTSGLVVPRKRKGFDRLIVIGDTTLTNNRGFDACDVSFKSWRYADDLNIAVPTNERHPKNGIYAVWFRDRVEADEELKDLSARQIAGMKINTITLLERELYELVYHMETGQHLDIQNWTLCSGSRFSDGDVPHAFWFVGRFKVYFSSPDDHNPNLRSREAVVSL